MNNGSGLSSADRGRLGAGPRPRPMSSQSQPAIAPSGPVHGQDDRYWRARKSLRLWPIIGADLGKAVAHFLTETLQMDKDIADEVKDLSLIHI